MSKFEVELELTGLKFKIRGDRQTVPSITRNLGQQMAGLFQPAAQIADEEPKQVNFLDAELVSPSPVAKARARRSKRSNGAAPQTSNGTAHENLVIDFKHDPNTWGMPQQSWVTADKAIWLLYVVNKVCNTEELSSGQIAQTFNRHYRQSGRIQTGNVTRDLGKRKAENPALVGQDTTKADEPWYLTDEGIRHAESLVLSSKGPSQASLI